MGNAIDMTNDVSILPTQNGADETVFMGEKTVLYNEGQEADTTVIGKA